MLGDGGGNHGYLGVLGDEGGYEYLVMHGDGGGNLCD